MSLRPIWPLLFFGLAAVSPLEIRAADLSQLKGETVNWARLKTPSEHWMRHAKSDPALMRFLREQSSLNIDPQWKSADVEDLKAMCSYPLLFSQGIDMINSPAARRNLSEYMQRGGFLLIDACINHGVTPDPDQFYFDQVEVLKAILPGVRFEPLPSDHPVYHSFFQIEGGSPHTSLEPRWRRLGMVAIVFKGRMVGIMSFAGMQCGWDGMDRTPTSVSDAMKMLVNIYVFAMLQ